MYTKLHQHCEAATSDTNVWLCRQFFNYITGDAYDLVAQSRSQKQGGVGRRPVELHLANGSPLAGCEAAVRST